VGAAHAPPLRIHRRHAGQEPAERPGGREREGVDAAAVEVLAHVDAAPEAGARLRGFEQIAADRVVHPHVVHAIPDDEREREPEDQQAFLDLRHTFRLKAEATSTVPSFPPSGGRSVPHAEATTRVPSFPPSGGRLVAHAEATTTVLSFSAFRRKNRSATRAP